LQRIKLRVYFVDGACKSLAVTEEATFLDLLYILVNKLSMGDTQPTSKTAQLLSQMFAFFSVTGDNSEHKLLDWSALPIEAMNEWTTSHDHFLFKRVLVIRDHCEREVSDDVVLDLTWRQAHRALLSHHQYRYDPLAANHSSLTSALNLAVNVTAQSSSTPSSPATGRDSSALVESELTSPWTLLDWGVPSPDEALDLAALSVLISAPIGATNGLSTTELRALLSRGVWTQRRAADWEVSLSKQVQSFKARGLTPRDAMKEYLKIAQNLTFYGAMFFFNCKSCDSNSSLNSALATKKIPNKLVIAVNEDGIILLRREGTFLAVYPFAKIKNWSASFSSFSFEVDETQLEFETAEGETIALVVQLYIDHLIDDILLPSN
jgi:hypothetical protein